MTLEIRRLNSSDAEELMELRRIALHEAPHAFASSPEDDYARTLEAVRESLKPTFPRWPSNLLR